LLARIRVHLANARMTHSARTALDTFGRFLLATDHAGRVLWCTPQAARLLSMAFRGFETDSYVLPAPVQDWLRQRTATDAASPPDTLGLQPDLSSVALELTYIGQIGPDEILLRLVEGRAGDDRLVLQRKLMLTQRESEVLLWIAHGKSNRDIAEILTLSPRTVNKHLEQIYTKLGVENRASATALAVRTLGTR
jgi:DNA-binding CsgD family transcriptional regulator